MCRLKDRFSGYWARTRRLTLAAGWPGWLLLFAGCSVGPDYVRPPAATPDAYKENAGWKVAQPRDELPRGKWWEIYQDPRLNDLEAQVDITNQNLAAAEANFRQAVALIRVARAGYFPTVTGGPSWSRFKRSENLGSSNRNLAGASGTGPSRRQYQHLAGSHLVGLPAELQRRLGTGHLGQGAPQRGGQQSQRPGERRHPGRGAPERPGHPGPELFPVAGPG